MTKAGIGHHKLPDEIAGQLSGFRRTRIEHGCVADVYCYSSSESGESYYLKRHRKHSLHDSVKERQVIDWLQGKLPVPAVKSFQADDEYHYTLLSALPGIPAHKLIHRLKPYEMIRMLVRAMKQVHSVETDGCPFDESVDAKLERIIHGLKHNFLRPDIHHKRAERSAASDLAYLRQTRPASEDLVFTHGDFCLPNFLVENERVTGFIDLGEAGICDRYMDICTFAITMCHNYQQFDRFFEFARLIFSEYGIQNPDWNKLHYYHLINEMI